MPDETGSTAFAVETFMTKFSLLPIIGLLALSACSETNASYRPVYPMPVPTVRTGGQVDEQACLQAVARQTNASVMVLSSEFSQANSLIMVGVGPRNAPWKCLSSNGVVAEITSMTNEGAL